MKDLMKRFFSNDIVITIIAWIGHFYVLFVYKTSKLILRGDYNSILKYLKTGKGLAMFTWHGRIMLPVLQLREMIRDELKKGKTISVLSSMHRDGKIASKILSTFGLKIIEGSTIDPKKGDSKNKKAITSLRAIMKTLNEGNICIFAADAPRGPAFIMNSKITEIVKKTNTAIIGAVMSYKHKKQFNTWDHFQLAYPFNRLMIEYGKLVVMKDVDNYKEINQSLEDEINGIMKRNDEEIIK